MEQTAGHTDQSIVRVLARLTLIDTPLPYCWDRCCVPSKMTFPKGNADKRINVN